MKLVLQALWSCISSIGIYFIYNFFYFLLWDGICSNTLVFGKLFQNRTAESVWFLFLFIKRNPLGDPRLSCVDTHTHTHTNVHVHRCVVLCVSVCLYILLSQCLQTDWLRDKALWPGIRPTLSLALSLSPACSLTSFCLCTFWICTFKKNVTLLLCSFLRNSNNGMFYYPKVSEIKKSQ